MDEILNRNGSQLPISPIPSELESLSLEELESRVQSDHLEVTQGMRQVLRSAKHAGDKLRAIKAKLGHGKWGPWLNQARKHGVGSPETVRTYMRISSGWSEIEPVASNGGITIEEARKILSKPRGNRSRPAQEATELQRAIDDVWEREELAKWIPPLDPLLLHWKGDQTRKLLAVAAEDERERRRHCTGKLFLDCGAFSLQGGQLSPGALEHYRDHYARFLHRYGKYFDHYANFDLIGDPARSHQNLVVLRSKGLDPVPVVHYPANPDVLNVYYGSRIIGLGGLVGKTSSSECQEWIKECFDQLGPHTRVHGFGVAGLETMLKYPWYSVDSTGWNVPGRSRQFSVPIRRGGRFVFDETPRKVNASQKPDKQTRTWLDEIGVEWQSECETGVSDPDKGYIYCHKADLKFWQRFQQEVPNAPVIYFSGESIAEALPETVLGNESNLMLTYRDFHNSEDFDAPHRIDKRFESILRQREGLLIDPAKVWIDDRPTLWGDSDSKPHTIIASKRPTDTTDLFEIPPDADLSTRFVGLVSCGSAKRPGTWKARELYTGEFAAAGIKWASNNLKVWRILSAKHHVLKPDDEVENYEQKLPERKAERERWDEEVKQQLIDEFGEDQVFLSLNRRYTRKLTKELRIIEVFGAFQDCKMAHQIKWLQAHPSLTCELLERIRLGDPGWEKII